MRPKQWTKNLLFVFPAIIFDGQLFDPTAFGRVFLSFLLLCLASGTVYIINDLVDIESDRQHPRKQHRPLPSGQLPIPLAIGAAILFPIVTLVIAWSFSQPLALLLALYLAIQLGYSFVFKHIAIIDVMILTSGFVLRVAAGVVVINVTNFSPWLYVCAGLLALMLAVGKRRQELILLGANANNVRKIYEHYNLELLDEMLRISMISTLITYIVYTIETTAPALQGNNYALLTVPFVIYGLFRYLYLIHVKGEISPPDEVLLKDRPLQVALVLFALTVAIIIYIV